MTSIRPLEEKDVNNIHALGSKEASFNFATPGFWTKEQLSAWFRCENDVCLGAFKNDEIIGFALASLHTATGKATWENIYVVPHERNTGVAETLIETMMKRLETKGAIYVHLLADNQRADLHTYFNKFGFESNGAFMWMGKSIVRE